MSGTPEMMAVCGLDCGTCTLRTMLWDVKAAHEVIGWFRSMGWLEENQGMEIVREKRMFCRGCHGPRDEHWSADCRLLKCAVDNHGVQHCHQCPEFACQMLTEWATENDGYAAALDRLKRLNTAC
jgi:hypothetical protein